MSLKPNSVGANFEFSLAKDQGSLTVSINQGFKPKDNTPVVILNLTATHADTSIDINQWFEIAHKSIVDIFLGLVNQEVKQEWGFKWSH